MRLQRPRRASLGLRIIIPALFGAGLARGSSGSSSDTLGRPPGYADLLAKASYGGVGVGGESNNDTAGSWDLYRVTADADGNSSWRLVAAATLHRSTFVYDRLRRWQLGADPATLERLLPAAVTRIRMPVQLANGTVLHVQSYPSVDWSQLFMHNVVATQELRRRIADAVTAAQAAENGTFYYASAQLEDAAARQNTNWRTAKQLQAERVALEAEIDALEMESARLRADGERSAELFRLRRTWADSSAARELELLAEVEALAVALERESRVAELLLRTERAANDERRRLESGRAAIGAKTGAARQAIAAEADRAAQLSVASVLQAAEIARLNEELNLRRIRARGEEERQKVREVVRATFQTLTAAALELVQDPALLLKLTLTLLGIAGGVITARHAAAVARGVLERRFARPKLVRETSRPPGALAAALAWISYFPSRLVVVLYCGRRSRAKDCCDGRDRRDDGAAAVAAEEALDGVVLAAETEQQVRRLIKAIRGARGRKAPLRHVLIHGPPGTGKTLVARRIAQACGMDHAAFSGGDLGPLGASAASELHRLLLWARSSPRGLLLLLDEAEAALPDRTKRRPSEAARCALNAFLHHTGEPARSFMLVVATNRPEELDVAVLDRIDDIVELLPPALEERRRLCRLYFDACLARKEQQRDAPHGFSKCEAKAKPAAAKAASTFTCWLGRVSTVYWRSVERLWRALRSSLLRFWPTSRHGLLRIDPNFDVQSATAHLAAATAGMSGRDIERISLAVQAAVFGSDDCLLTQPLWERVTTRKIAELAGKKTLAACAAFARRGRAAALPSLSVTDTESREVSRHASSESSESSAAAADGESCSTGSRGSSVAAAAVAAMNDGEESLIYAPQDCVCDDSGVAAQEGDNKEGSEGHGAGKAPGKRKKRRKRRGGSENTQK